MLVIICITAEDKTTKWEPRALGNNGNLDYHEEWAWGVRVWS